MDYRELFYKSQVEIANAISDLERISARLVECMKKCEQELVTAEDYDEFDEED